MKKLTINEKEINIPQNWDEVTVEEYIHITSTLQDSIKEEKGNLSILIDILSSMYNLTKKELYALDTELFGEIIDCFQFVSKPIIPKEIKDEIEFEGKKYKFKTNFNKMTTGEVISFEMMVQNKTDIYKELDKILAILIREIDENGKEKEFDSDKVEEYIKMVNRMSVTDVYKLSLFFSNGVASYTKNMQVYSE